MTYKNSLLIVILLTLVFITNSCSKQDISEEQKPSLSTAIHLPENAQNQYDYAGKLHNDAISKYLKNYIHKGLTVQRIADFSNKFVMDNRNSIQGLAYAQGRMVASDLSSGEIIQKFSMIRIMIFEIFLLMQMYQTMENIGSLNFQI
jgi:hypothetical protein